LDFFRAHACFLAVASVVYHYTRNLVVPFVGWMLIIGTSYSILRTNTHIFEEWPSLTLSPEIVLHLLVPLLVFESGRKFGVRDFEKEKIPITFFSVVGVILTVFLVGIPTSFLLDIPLLHGLMFGAIIAPTDPVAVNAAFKKFTIPKRLKTQMEGESLFNDATGVLLFTMMYGIVIENQRLAPENAILFFLQSIGVGMLGGIGNGMDDRHTLKHLERE
jgi:CPA1 family monovalent cation:H+ antiporter